MRISFFRVTPLRFTNTHPFNASECFVSDPGFMKKQVLYPLLMFATVVRTLLVRVRPGVLLIFKTYDEDGTNGNARNCRGTPASFDEVNTAVERRGGRNGGAVGWWGTTHKPGLRTIASTSSTLVLLRAPLYCSKSMRVLGVRNSKRNAGPQNFSVRWLPVPFQEQLGRELQPLFLGRQGAVGDSSNAESQHHQRGRLVPDRV